MTKSDHHPDSDDERLVEEDNMGTATISPDTMLRLRKRISDHADERIAWVRQNLNYVMDENGLDANMIYAMSGVAAGTVRGFLSGSTDTGIRNVVLICLSTGVPLAEYAQPPADFIQAFSQRSRKL